MEVRGVLESKGSKGGVPVAATDYNSSSVVEGAERVDFQSM